MARRGRGSSGRMFIWARIAGVLPVNETGAAAVDLLGAVRSRFGGKEFAGTTVSAVKGYARPGGELTSVLFGRMGIRVCNEGDIPEGDPTQPLTVAADGPSDGRNAGGGPEFDWMGFFPFYMAADRPPDIATWNTAASPYAIDVRSNRRMEELGDTLGLFVDFAQTPDDASGLRVDYDLSVGLKLS